MPDKIKISSIQAIFLIVTTIFSTMVIYLPTFIIEISKQEGWLSVIPAVLAGLVVGGISSRLGLRFPDQTIIQYAPTLLGWLLGKLVGFIFIFTFILLNSFIVREFAEIFTTIFMPETPMYVFLATILLVAAYSVKKGLEVLVRANAVTLIFYMSIMVMILSMSMPNAILTNLTPILEHGIVRVLEGAYPATVFIGEVFVITMLIPYLAKPGDAKKIAFWSVILAGLLLFALMIAGISVFNCEASRTQFIALSLARRISIGDFIERMDPLVMLMWMGGLLIKVTVFYFLTVLGLKQWLNLKKSSVFVIPVGLIIGAMATYMWPNALIFRFQLSKILPGTSMPIQLGIPLILLVVAMLRGKGVKGK